MDAPFGSWGTQTLIAGLTQDARIAPWVIKGAMDGPAFAASIRQVLVPEIEPGTVVIRDNLATHSNKEAAQALRDHGCWFLYPPPYAPDLNCLIPWFDGAIHSLEWKEVLWAKFVTAAPRPRSRSEQQYSDRKFRSRS